MTNKTLKKSKIGIFALSMLITGSIDSIRNLPASALFGSTLIIFFIFGAVVFLIPVALVSAELSSIQGLRGGVYNWVCEAFGKRVGLLAIWLQWINTMVWYPTILSFIAGTAAFLINPSLATNKIYIISVILVVYWLLTLINLNGLRVSTWFATWCAVIGMVIPMMLIILLALLWLLSGAPLSIKINSHTIFPDLHHSQNWVSMTAIMTAFLGMELAAVHVNDISNAQKTFPKALLISVVFILLTMVLGSLAIAFVIPHDHIRLVQGVMQAFSSFLGVYHLSGLVPVLAFMLLLGCIGSMVNWMISPAKGLLQAAEQGYLPRFLQKINKNNVAQNLLLLQALLVSVICLAFLLMPSINGSYWLLTDLSTQVYLIMYMLMFAAAIVLKVKLSDKARHFSIPGGRPLLFLVSSLGILGCSLALYIGFIPPASINVGGKLHYMLVFAVGLILMVFPVCLLYGYRQLTTVNT